LNTKGEKNDTVISVRTSRRSGDRLAALARVTKRSKSYLANEAIERYLAEEEAFVASVKQGIADAKAGRVHSTEGVRQQIDALIAKKHS
jgi:predicted transcriptional regulator